MQVHAPTRGPLVACLIAPSLLALPALAGTPKALDHVPADAQAVVVVPNLGGLLDDIDAVNALMGERASAEALGITSMIRGWPGVNLGGSVAAVMDFENGQDEPDVVLLVPVSDFQAFTRGIAAENGVVEFPFFEGEVMYARDAGDGLAVVAEEPNDARNFDAKGGQGDAHTAHLGKAGGRIAESNDIFVLVNLIELDDQIAEGLKELDAQGDMVEMMGGAEAAKGFDQMSGVLHTVAADALSFSMGLSFDQAGGFSIDHGLQFKDDSTTAAYLNNEGDAGKYFAHVPAMDYFFAASYDLSGEGIQKFMGQYTDWLARMDTTGLFAQSGMKKLITDVKGGAQLMGAPDNGNLMGGLFNNVVYYADVKDPGAFIGSIREVYAGMGDSMAKLAQQGVKLQATMDEQPTEINGVKAYGYSISMDMAQMNDNAAAAMAGPNPAMILQMMFGGAGGPSGYIAQAGDGVVMTLSRDAANFSRAAKAAKGESTLGAVPALGHTRDMLPANRVMEMYIGADHLVNTAGPMLMMFGVIPEFEPLGALPPLGVALTADGGGLMLRTVLPSETVLSIMKLVPQDAWDSMHGGDDGWDADQDQDEDDEGGMDF